MWNFPLFFPLVSVFASIRCFPLSFLFLPSSLFSLLRNFLPTFFVIFSSQLDTGTKSPRTHEAGVRNPNKFERIRTNPSDPSRRKFPADEEPKNRRLPSFGARYGVVARFSKEEWERGAGWRGIMTLLGVGREGGRLVGGTVSVSCHGEKDGGTGTVVFVVI